MILEVFAAAAIVTLVAFQAAAFTRYKASQPVVVLPARPAIPFRKDPQGWIIDADGRHTTDPTQYRKGGALLPLGGTEGYKGSGLAAMVEVLCGLLTGLGFGVEPTGRHNDGCFLAVFKVDAFRPLAEFKREVTEFARYLKDTRSPKDRPACSIPARSNICASRSGARMGSRSRTRPGRRCASSRPSLSSQIWTSIN